LKIDPYAWLLTAPATIALIQLYFQPAENIVKRLWRDFSRCEAIVWERLGWMPTVTPSSRERIRNRVVFAAVVMGFATASLASFSAFVGLMPSS
jgi:hypothetical protein